MLVNCNEPERIDWRRDLAGPVGLMVLLWAVTVGLLLLVRLMPGGGLTLP